MGAPNVVRIHPEIPHLSARAHQQLDMIELIRELDPDSQQVVVSMLERQTARLRRLSPTGRLLRGELGPVAWRRGEGEWLLAAPAARRWLWERANS